MEVVNDALVAGTQKPPHHVGSHPAQSDHAQFHVVFLSLVKTSKMKPSWSNFLVLQRLDFRQAALVAWSAAEVSGQKGLDQFPGERRPDHSLTQAKNVHIVIFDALVGGENIMDKPGTHPGNFVRGDGCSDTAAADGHSTVHFSRGNGPGKGNDEVRVVVFGVQLVCAEVHDLIPRAAKLLRQLLFQGKPTMVRGDSHTHHDFSLA
jgi:hypothetical protein